MTSAHISLRLLATTDLHGALLSYDYFRDQPAPGYGLSRTAALIQNARAEASNSILLDNGDFLQGSLMSDLFAQPGTLADTDTHPVIAAFNALGYDAVTIGNHEFDYGVPFLERVLRDADFQVVLSNLSHAAPRGAAQATLFQPYTLLDRTVVDAAGQRHAITLGVIGFTPPQVLNWNHDQLAHRFCADHPVATARALVPRMRAEGADIVIALSHGGLGSPRLAPDPDSGLKWGSDDGENASAALAMLDGIDAVVAGHVHQVFPSMAPPLHPKADPDAGTIQGTPAVMPGLWGSHLGVIDLTLEHRDGRWIVRSGTAAARPLVVRDDTGAIENTVHEDPALTAVVAPAHVRTLEYTRTRIGDSPLPLHSYFSSIGVDHAARAVMRAQSQAVTRAVAGTPLDQLPILSAASAGKAGGLGGPENYTDIPPGPIRLRDLVDLYGFGNVVVALIVTGAELRDWLDRATALYNRIDAGNDGALLLGAQSPSYLLDAIDGLDYRVALDRTPRFDPGGRVQTPGTSRIVDLRHRGTPVADDAQFLLACTSHRAHGGGTYPATGPDRVTLDTGIPVRDALTRFVVDDGLASMPRTPLFGFAPLGGTRVSFRAGPGALKHLAELPNIPITDLGLDQDGFSRLSITV